MAELESIDYSNDILQPMQSADLLRYRDICAQQLPAKLWVHHFLTIQHRWMEIFSRPENEALTRNISSKCRKSFYAPRTASVDNCTFVAISDSISDNTRYCIYAFTFEWPPTELVCCLRDTARIDWKTGPLIEALSEELVPVVGKMLADAQINVEWSISIACFWMSIEEAIAIDMSIPDEYFFDQLDEHHATTIDDSWAFRSDTSHKYIRSMLQLNGGLGLFEKSTKRILAWILTNDHFAFGCLETIPAARRKGLAKLLIRKYSKQFAANEKLDIFTYVAAHNSPSLRLFEGIGFRKFHTCNWVQVEKRFDK